MGAYSMELQSDKERKRRVDAVQFFTDPYYLGGRVDRVRAQNQLTIIKVIYGLKDQLTEEELIWLEQLQGEGKTNWSADHEGEYTIIILEVGQRSGKTFLGVGLAIYEYYCWTTYDNPHTELLLERGKRPIAKGAPIEIKCVATSEDNAKDHAFAEMVAWAESSPWMSTHIRRIGTLSITGIKGCNLLAGASTAAALRGGTSLASYLDELSWMLDTKGKAGAKEVYRAHRNATKTLSGKIFAISSPCHDADQLHELGVQAKAGRLKDAIWFNLSTWEFDPSQRREDFANEEETDPEDFSRSFLAQASAPIEAFFRDQVKVDRFLESLPHPGGMEAPVYGVRYSIEEAYHEAMRTWFLTEYEPEPGCDYYIGGDPSESADAFGYAIAHRTLEGKVIIDLVGRFLPDRKTGREIDPYQVKAFLVRATRKVRAVRYVDDGFGYQETRSSIRDEGGASVKDAKLDSIRASAAKEAIYTLEAQCYYLPQLRKELVTIETKAGGKKLEFKRREGETGHGDMAYAVLQVIAEAYDPIYRKGGIRGIEVNEMGQDEDED